MENKDYTKDELNAILTALLFTNNNCMMDEHKMHHKNAIIKTRKKIFNK